MNEQFRINKYRGHHKDSHGNIVPVFCYDMSCEKEHFVVQVSKELVDEFEGKLEDLKDNLERKLAALDERQAARADAPGVLTGAPDRNGDWIVTMPGLHIPALSEFLYTLTGDERVMVLSIDRIGGFLPEATDLYSVKLVMSDRSAQDSIVQVFEAIKATF